jgi:Ca2+-transporting ATPase
MAEKATARPSDPLTHPWAVPAEAVLDELGVDLKTGLSGSQAASRRSTYGRNLLRTTKSRSLAALFIDQFKSLIILLLAAAAAVSFAFGEWIEALAVFAVILINAALGFFTEAQAVRSMESLRRLSRVDAVVRRDGTAQTVPAEDLVPGDILIVEGGSIVTADARIAYASKLQADESTLTGESVPVEKSVEAVAEDAPPAERLGVLFKGTSVSRGSAEAVVTATGMETELGQISSLVEEAEEEITPLEKRLEQLGRSLVWVTLVITAGVSVSGILRGRDVLLMIQTGVALAVAAIPEGLPVVATIALARGMLRMARRNALINRLASVETLGATSVLCTDKTGTLTTNRMWVERLLHADGVVVLQDRGDERNGSGARHGDDIRWEQETPAGEAMLAAVLCNNASLSTEGTEERSGLGDPMEVALLEAGEAGGLIRSELVERMPEEKEEAFDSDTKRMATFHRTENGFRVAVKGAPESILAGCTTILGADGESDLPDEEKRRWLGENEKMAEGGLRVLALARRRVDHTNVDPYEDMTFLGLVGLLDPPHPDVGDAVRACHRAGVRLIMVTGDQPATALNIARRVELVPDAETRVVLGRDLKPYKDMTEDEKEGLLPIPIFARVSPGQKLDIIELHQKAGSVVAMTGDGVNDAPALKKADIGVAMGRRGTQVAREASDMVLRDDAFASIVAAIEQGRIIFRNIRVFVLYLLSCNVSEVLAVGISSLANLPLPLLPLQILFLNLVTDVFPALALGAGEGDPGIMDDPPRPSGEPILARAHWLRVATYGGIIAGTALASIAVATRWLGLAGAPAVTISFLTLALAQLWHVFNMRAAGSSPWKNEVTRNRFVWGALVLCAGLLLVVLYVPLLANVLGLSPPARAGWLVALGFSFVPLALGQVLNAVGFLSTRRS